MKLQCPKCGNWVEGKKVDTLARKATRKVVRKGGMTAVGAAIGSIIPGAGTLVGGAIGLAADVLLDDYWGDVTNEVEQVIFDETKHEFRCPTCGRWWTKIDRQSSRHIPSHSLSQNPTITLNGNSSSINSLDFHSSHSYCFCLETKGSLSKYEFAAALTAAKLAANVTDALQYYDAIPINLNIHMSKQDVDSAQNILKKKCIPFRLQLLQTEEQPVNQDSVSIEKELEIFWKYLNDYLNNTSLKL